MTELSDELLVSYVDGQLARDQSRAVKGVLDHDEVSAQRVAALKAAHDRLETAFDALLAGEFVSLTGMQPPSHLEDAVPEPGSAPRRGRGALMTMLGIFLLGLGAAGGYVAHDHFTLVPTPWRTVVEVKVPADPQEQTVAAAPPRIVAENAAEAPFSPARPAPNQSVPGQLAEAEEPAAEEEPLITGSVAPVLPPRATTWRDDAERAFSLYGRDSLEVSLDSQSNPEFVRFQMSKALDREVSLPDLSAQGLAFKRLQILQHEGAPLAQMLYLPTTGDPVALYAKAAESHARSSTTLHATEEIGMASWTHDGVAYLLAARLPEDRITELAKAVRAPADQNSDQN